MSKNELLIRSACLATKEKLPDKVLSTGKINPKEKNQFLFYLIEVITPWTAGQKVKKAIIETLETHSLSDDKLGEDEFEKILTEINQSLGKIVSQGESSWVGNLNALIGLADNKKIFISQTGRVSGYLFRENKISSLADQTAPLEAPHPFKTFSDITEGRFVNKDRIVIGNTELYNHFSLDYIRRSVDNLSAPEFILEFSKVLKKNKILTANIFVFESIDRKTVEKEPLINVPDVIYIDTPDEGIAKRLSKKYGPKTKEILKKSKTFLSKTATSLGRFIKKYYKILQKNWQEKYKPRAKKIIGKSVPAIAKAIDAGKKTVTPQIEKLKQDKNFDKLKIKTKNYAHKSNSVFAKLLSFLVNFLTFIKKWTTKKENRKYILLGAIIILIFFGFFKLIVNNINHDQTKNKQETALAYDKAKEAYSKAKEEQALGRVTNSSEFEVALSLAKKAQESDANRSDALILTKKIQADIDQINKIYRIYTDSSTSFSVPGNRLHAAQIGSTIYIINSEGRIYSANTGDKDPRLIASLGKNDGEPLLMTSSDTNNEIYIFTESRKLFIFNSNTNVISEITISEEGVDWEDTLGIATFSSNLYLLNKSTGSILKHTRSSSGYSAGSSYINNKKDHPENAVDISIDGNIYVLSSDGTVSKYSRGAKDLSFSISSISGSSSKMEQPAKIYTADDTNFIYILDKKLNVVIKFNKSGQFISKYALDGSNIFDFTINEKLKKLWLVSDNNIFETDL